MFPRQKSVIIELFFWPILEIFTNLKINIAYVFAYLWLDKISLLGVELGWLVGVPRIFLKTFRVPRPQKG
jgi:hypothetical protein